jgi:branched-chain amino acid transport system ATP-binding protein
VTITKTPLLQIADVTAGFGATTVLHGVSLSLPEGTIAGIFGLNGAGKSVTLKTVAGILPARSGAVLLDGEDITGWGPEKRVAHGMGHIPQGRQVFPALTVEENLRLGAYTLRRRTRSRYAAALDEVYDRFPVLRERRGQLAGTMSGGQQASLCVARALINGPRLILVDEPSAGLTMLLVEQNIAFGLSLADTAHLMQTGVVVHTAPVAELDQSTLAQHLGIGNVLGAATNRMLGSRASTAPSQRGKPRGRRTA